MLHPGECIYQIVTDRFCEGNPAGRPRAELFSSGADNLRKYLGGDWAGIIARIQDGYLTGMGFSAILISQPAENIDVCMEDEEGTASYHGYWPRDFLRPNPYFGSMDTFRALLSAAHEHGIKVIIDFTPNHTSPALELRPDYMENGAIYRAGRLVATYSGDMERVFLHNGGTAFRDAEDSLYRNLYDLAGLDQMNPQADELLREGIAYWLDQGVDGVRIDAAQHIPPGWLTSLSAFIHARKPAYLFGEWFLEAHGRTQDNAAFANGSGMSLLHFMFTHAIREAFHGRRGFGAFADMLRESSGSYKYLYDQLIFLDNHDMSRFTRASEPWLTDLALVLLLTSAGLPVVYYGTEQYMSGGEDPHNRAMMSSFSRETTAYRLVAQLNRLRACNLAIGYGSTKLLYVNPGVLVFERSCKRDVALIFINQEESAQILPPLVTSLPQGAYSSLLKDIYPDRPAVAGAEGDIQKVLLAPRSAYVYVYESDLEEPAAVHVYPKAAAPGSELMIRGRHLGDTGRLTVGGYEAAVISWQSEQIVARIPAVPAGTHPVEGLTVGKQKFRLPEELKVWTGTLVTVRLVVKNVHTDYDTRVYVTGNVYELGAWQAEKAAGPFYNHIVYRYPTWYCDVSLPADSGIEFKILLRSGSGVVRLEQGEAHSLHTPAEGVSEMIVEWQGACQESFQLSEGDAAYG
ncbi:alpha-amylase family glycosyl hydrolase [Paenibacillus graminis]|uniref:alpha-amylase family glycosyl hydrolase n=1 Tax=Paenibacillus graminis TaxID=189425 RepID=UPI002DB639CE|nr:alpha-amylase family glycosyl hydrolase [Paenibacillus graminis]MEC0171592.1 alpha-amylase family glycosyl hydrolase [Paenibacillus graminis]